MSPKISADARWMQGLAPPGIVTVGDPYLCRKTRLVKPRDRGLVRALARRMVTKLDELNAQGLAAPQIRENLRLVVIQTRPKELAPDVTRSPLYIMINPEIINCSSKFLWGWEGCLSVPGLMGLVRRYQSVEVHWEDLDGEHHRELFTGYLARVVQHEVDHLNNLLYFDRRPVERMAVRTLTTIENRKRL